MYFTEKTVSLQGRVEGLGLANKSGILIVAVRKFFTLVLSVAALSSIAASAYASSVPAVTQSYTSEPGILPGMIVRLKPETSNVVEPLDDSDLSKLIGVVVPVDDAPIVLSSPTITNQQVLVASTGRYDVLVSNQNGPVKVGDYISISSLAGVAMKSSTSQAEVIGQAVGSFNGTSNVLGTESVKNTLGKSTTESIGSIPINIDLEANPLYAKVESGVPSFVSKGVNDIANKKVNTVRIYVALVVIFATVVIVLSLLYGGVSSSVIATGRNPLAKRYIGKNLFGIIASGLIVLIIGLLAAYLILKL
jgi:hypothetical protein